MIESIIRNSLTQAKDELEMFIADPGSVPSIEKAVEIMSECLSAGGKILSCGNGDS